MHLFALIVFDFSVLVLRANKQLYKCRFLKVAVVLIYGESVNNQVAPMTVIHIKFVVVIIKSP